MNLVFAKLYEEYIRKKESARYKITIYISIFYFLLAITILLPVKTFLDNNVFKNQIHNEKLIVIIGVFGLLGIITFLVYLFYIRNNYIHKLTEKHKCRKIHKVFLYLIVVLTPVTLLLLAGTITVFLNGGEILGNKIIGLFE
jgi:SNF family Na+-dependent transporter